MLKSIRSLTVSLLKSDISVLIVVFKLDVTVEVATDISKPVELLKSEISLDSSLEV